MKPMTESEWQAFLRAGTRTGKLAFVLPSGRPTVAPVWVVLEDDGVIRGQTTKASAKAKAFARDARASLIVDLEAPPYAFVRVDGEIALDEDPAEVRRIATATGARYMGADRAEEFGARNGGEDELGDGGGRFGSQAIIHTIRIVS